VAGPNINFDLLLAGILRKARGEPDARVWLTARHEEALSAVMAGDEFVTATSFKGESGSSERQMPANTLLQLYELALQQLDAEDAAAAAGSSRPGSVSYADFSQGPCTLG